MTDNQQTKEAIDNQKGKKKKQPTAEGQTSNYRKLYTCKYAK